MTSRRYDSPLRSEQTEATRTRILEAVAALLLEKHPATLSIPAVARRAGVSVATVYHHFGSKESLLVEVNRYTDQLVYERMPNVEITLDNLAETLPDLFAASLEFEPFLQAREISPLGRELGNHRSDARQEFDKRFLAPVADQLPAGSENQLNAVLNAIVSWSGLQRMREYGLSVPEASRLMAWAVHAVIDHAIQTQQVDP